ncbi:hypothetical protein BGZ89_009037 [Linnemannia elongata]|nr:hypothetical protein BGZ89_009037 [Linnemannia elongata]
MAQSVAWMMYSILRNETDPSVIEKLVREIDQVLGDSVPTMRPTISKSIPKHE